LQFTLIRDSCDIRILTISVFHWVKLHVGIDNTDISSMMKIYPNPTKGKLCIESEIMERVEVFDVTGKFVYETVVSSDVLDVDLSGFRKGVYFVRIITEKGIVVERIVLL